MPSALPTDSAASKAVDVFGIGIFDDSQFDSSHGYDDVDVPRSSLPTAGGSQLPSDASNPAARSDYYDKMQTGRDAGPWAMEDTGAYAGEECAESELPTEARNDISLDNFLGSLGNAWSGNVIEDQSGATGFPVQQKNAGGDVNKPGRMATNIDLVGTLAQDFLKKFGKKDLTRRHVMAFLQDEGHNMFLASDVIRCLKHRHKVVISDALDIFPNARTASTGSSLVSAWQTLVDVGSDPSTGSEVASVFRKCAADIAHTLADLERFKD